MFSYVALTKSIWDRNSDVGADSPAQNTRSSMVTRSSMLPESQEPVSAQLLSPSVLASMQYASQLVPRTQFSHPSVPASGRPQKRIKNNQSQVQEVEAQQGKAFTCSFVSCPGYPFKPALQCVVCHADVHPPCVNLVIQGQQAVPGKSYCSTQCICNFGDDNINHDGIQQLNSYPQLRNIKVTNFSPLQNKESVNALIMYKHCLQHRKTQGVMHQYKSVTHWPDMLCYLCCHHDITHKHR
jgi:hypothetical protein